MFKKVEYCGFDKKPELRQLARKAVTVLEKEIDSWQDKVEVVVKALEENPIAVEIFLTLILPVDSGIGFRVLSVKELENPETLLRYCRDVWDQALGSYLEKRKLVWDEIVRQPVVA
jgi:hypothetical protein